MEIGITAAHAYHLKYWGKWEHLFQKKTSLNQYLWNGYEPFFHIMKKEKISFLYFGNSFCQYELPSVEEVKEAIHFCDEHELQLVILTPPVTDYGIEKILNIIKRFDGKDGPAVVVNDFGAAEALIRNQYKGELIWGRVLDKTIRELRMTDLEQEMYYSPKGKEYMFTLASTAEYYTSVLKNYKVIRLQTDCSKTEFKENNKLYYDYIFPTEYVTTGRMCMYRIAGQDTDNKYLLNDSCKRLCRGQKQFLTKPIDYLKLDKQGNRIRELQMVRKGNTLFTLHAVMGEIAEKNRLIIDMGFLF